MEFLSTVISLSFLIYSIAKVNKLNNKIDQELTNSISELKFFNECLRERVKNLENLSKDSKVINEGVSVPRPHQVKFKRTAEFKEAARKRMRAYHARRKKEKATQEGLPLDFKRSSESVEGKFSRTA